MTHCKLSFSDEEVQITVEKDQDADLDVVKPKGETKIISWLSLAFIFKLWYLFETYWDRNAFEILKFSESNMNPN